MSSFYPRVSAAGSNKLAGKPGTFGAILRDLLHRPDEIEHLGQAARQYVHDNFIGDLHLLRYAALIERLMTR